MLVLEESLHFVSDTDIHKLLCYLCFQDPQPPTYHPFLDLLYRHSTVASDETCILGLPPPRAEVSFEVPKTQG